MLGSIWDRSSVIVITDMQGNGDMFQRPSVTTVPAFQRAYQSPGRWSGCRIARVNRRWANVSLPSATDQAVGPNDAA